MFCSTLLNRGFTTASVSYTSLKCACYRQIQVHTAPDRQTTIPQAVRGDNPSSPSPQPGRRRRATTRRSTKVEPFPETTDQPATPASSQQTSRSTASNAPARRPPSRPSRRSRSSHSAAPAAAPAAAAGGDEGPALPEADATLPSADKQPATAAVRQPRKRPSSPLKPSPEQQQAEPPHIHYTLNSAVGSYSDINRCSVHLDEGEQAGPGPGSNGDGKPGTSQRSSSNGVGNGGTSHRSSRGGSRGSGNGTGADSTADDVRGLVYGATVRFSDSAALRLRRRAMVVWEKAGPRKVLIVKKPVPAAANTLRDMAAWLQRRGLQVFVEASVQASEFPELEPFDPAVTQVDFAITLGGDGTVLHLASLFAEDTPLPPVMCFAMGTLGFLTPFDAAQFRSCLARVLAANRRPLYCTLRTRKRCAVLDNNGQLKRVHHILNECVVDRGAFPSSVYLELYIDGSFVTAAEADGLIIATPSGSTAYSMSAGGSMVAPSVPCTLVTPLSPHSLSFRPLIIPENADLMIRLPDNARSHARASFDGKHPMRIAKGYSVHFETSLCPLPLINIGSLDVDWYEGITRKLKWNQSIRGVPGGGQQTAILQHAAAAAAAASNLQERELQPQLSLGGLMSDLTAAAHNEAKVASWVEEALLAPDAVDPAIKRAAIQ